MGKLETKTRHCQALRHRNHHPPRETLNHFYCIELSLLPTVRTSKRALSPFTLSLFPSLSLHFSLLFCIYCQLRSSSFSLVQFFITSPLVLVDNTSSKAFTPLWLPKWNKFFNSRIYRPGARQRISGLSPRFRSTLSTEKDYLRPLNSTTISDFCQVSRKVMDVKKDRLSAIFGHGNQDRRSSSEFIFFYVEFFCFLIEIRSF